MKKVLINRGGFTKQLIIIINLRGMYYSMPYPISKVGILKVPTSFLACIHKVAGVVKTCCYMFWLVAKNSEFLISVLFLQKFGYLTVCSCFSGLLQFILATKIFFYSLFKNKNRNVVII
jgi:hypothetical protein